MNLTTYTHKNIIMFTETTLPVQIDGGLFVRLCKLLEWLLHFTTYALCLLKRIFCVYKCRLFY